MNLHVENKCSVEVIVNGGNCDCDTPTGNSLRFEEWWPPLIVRESHMYLISCFCLFRYVTFEGHTLPCPQANYVALDDCFISS